MNLNKYLRTKVNNNIRHLFIKNSCEVCDSKDSLHLHHLRHFYTIVKDSLFSLKLEAKDTNDYTKEELRLITSVVLGEHLQTEYLTLCDTCHKEVHNVDRKHISCNKTYYEKRRIEKELETKRLIETVLIPYLDSIVGEKLFKDQQEELKEVFKRNGLNARTLGINTLNGNLKDRKLDFVIIPKKSGNKRYWMLELTGSNKGAIKK